MANRGGEIEAFLLDQHHRGYAGDGLVIEAIQKIAFRLQRDYLATVTELKAHVSQIPQFLPFRADRRKGAEKATESTCDALPGAIRASRDGEKPSASGSLTGAASSVRAGRRQRARESRGRDRQCREKALQAFHPGVPFQLERKALGGAKVEVIGPFGKQLSGQ